MKDIDLKDAHWRAGFIKRLLQIMEEQGIQEQQEFNQIVGVKRAITRWKNGETVPKLHSLLKIKERFRKSLDWLIHGEETIIGLAEYSDSYDSRAPAPTDLDLMAEVAQTIITYLDQHRLKINPRRLGKLIALGYEQCIVDKIKPQSLNIRALLPLSIMES